VALSATGVGTIARGRCSRGQGAGEDEEEERRRSLLSAKAFSQNAVIPVKEKPRGRASERRLFHYDVRNHGRRSLTSANRANKGGEGCRRVHYGRKIALAPARKAKPSEPTKEKGRLVGGPAINRSAAGSQGRRWPRGSRGRQARRRAVQVPL
jgi:hypothetical protein